MKTLITVASLLVILLCCRFYNGDYHEIHLTSDDNGSTQVISIRQPIIIDFSFKGGDYFYRSEYDSNILMLTNHYYTAPSSQRNEQGEYAIGATGIDTFKFTPTHIGTTDIKIESQPKNTISVPDVKFSTTIVVQ